MGRGVVLSDRDVLVGVFEDRAAVVVHVEVVGRGEDGDDGREVAFGGLAVHRVAGVLRFVASDDGEQVVAL